ncbi:hypothetical protein [Actinokineospora iranica]|nr:hypothetical protein [Actinokineospora iranica]
MDNAAAPPLPCPQPWRTPDGAPNAGKTPTGSARIVDADGAPGLLLPSRPTTVAAGVLLIVVGACFAVLGGLLIAGESVIGAVGGVVLGLLGVLLLAAGGFALRRKPRAVGIVLTPDHVVLNWLRPVVRLPWTSIIEIRPLALRMGRARTAPTRNYLGVVCREPGVVDERTRKAAARFGKDLACAVSMRSVDLDQLVVLHTLRFYLDNPPARAELAGEQAVVRVGAGRVTGTQ